MGRLADSFQTALRSAIAHLYFESIHPFEDGNGRIGRAIAEKALSQTIGRPVMLSLSQAIEADKKSYYQALEKAQRKNDITDFGWAISCPLFWRLSLRPKRPSTSRSRKRNLSTGIKAS